MAGDTITTTVAAELAAPDEARQQWVHLLPRGRMTTRDGRHFSLGNPGRVMTAFRRRRVDIPVDYEHSIQNARATEGVPAAGWISEMVLRDDGIWGKVRWTERAAAMIRAREYRYISPTMRIDGNTGEITDLVGAGLVHHPALELTALASEANMTETMDTTDTSSALDRIAEALGLEAGAGLDAVLGAIKALGNPDPKRFVPMEAVEDLMRDRNLRIATASEAEADRKADQAIAQGYITPAMRGWAVELCRSDMASFEAFLDKTTPPYAHLFKESTLPVTPEAGGRPASDDATEIARAIGVKPEDLRGA